MRMRFDEQLQQLNLEMIKLGVLCEDAITNSIEALFLSGDTEKRQRLTEKVMETEDDIDHKERQLENLCMKLLLRQQPVACDLRIVSSVLKMISDFERIGDQSADIAELARHLADTDLARRVRIRQMASETAKMVTDCVDAFVNKDLDGCRRVYEHDDVVDAMFLEVRTELIDLIKMDSENSGSYLDLLMTAKYLERIADHAVNIAGWVEYSITGVHGRSGAEGEGQNTAVVPGDQTQSSKQCSSDADESTAKVQPEPS